ncbi:MULTISPECIES: hypothetical protein [unclassified Chelatococcus]|uniref:hypothetical protein n=1 Tax=unclassified Chelatococcus TaxID=2638111 RepID=UPI001BCF25CB|nr:MULTISPECIES: hypothetical protein [unclassified Chelatococcus]MBS7700500.1 hypothetical protein [Chelatococcus sp. YT9]MBX3556296.1 hypothetical protein [Chelatococcus sp.]
MSIQTTPRETAAKDKPCSLGWPTPRSTSDGSHPSRAAPRLIAEKHLPACHRLYEPAQFVGCNPPDQEHMLALLTKDRC